MKQSLPELPAAKKARFQAEYGIRDYDAELLTASRELADYFEEVTRHFKNPVQAANWIGTELLGQLHRHGQSISECKVTPRQFAELLRMIESARISGKIAKLVLAEMLETGNDPLLIVQEKGLDQISDQSELAGLIDEVLARNSRPVEEFRSGNMKVLAHLVGEVMRATGGRANPQLVNDMLTKRLNG